MTRYLVNAEATYGFAIVLNPMTGNTENAQQFGTFETLEQAIEFYNSQIVEPYADQGPDVFNGGTKEYRKVFKQGGPLEWMNPLTDAEFQQPNQFGHGFHEVVVRFDNIQRLEQL